MKVLSTLMICVWLEGCLGAHIYVGADDKRLEDMTIVLDFGDLSAVNECSTKILPVLGFSTFMTDPIPERFKDMKQVYWDEDRPEDVSLSRSLPLIKYADNRIEMAECHICVVADRDILWEEIVSRCAGGTDFIPLSF